MTIRLFGYYQGESFGSDDIMYEAFDDRMLRRMNSTEEKTIDAVIRMQKRWQDAGMPGSFREEEAQTEISAEEINPKEEKRYVRWVVCYTMESGRRYTVAFWPIQTKTVLKLIL